MTCCWHRQSTWINDTIALPRMCCHELQQISPCIRKPTYQHIRICWCCDLDFWHMTLGIWYTGNNITTKVFQIWEYVRDLCFCCFLLLLVSLSQNSYQKKPTRKLVKMCQKSEFLNGPLTWYLKLQFAHAPGIPGTFSPAAGLKETAC